MKKKGRPEKVCESIEFLRCDYCGQLPKESCCAVVLWDDRVRIFCERCEPPPGPLTNLAEAGLVKIHKVRVLKDLEAAKKEYVKLCN